MLTECHGFNMKRMCKRVLCCRESEKLSGKENYNKNERKETSILGLHKSSYNVEGRKTKENLSSKYYNVIELHATQP